MMEKTEFTVGEIFQFGLKKLKVVEAIYKHKCALCFFADMCHWNGVDDLVGECDGDYRTDGREIVFKEVKE